MPLVGFVLGVVFAWVAADELARGPGRAAASRSLVVVALFGLLVYAPSASVLLAFGPDWSFAYLVNSQRIPTLATSALVLVDAASVPLGFALGAHLAAERRLGTLVRLAALPALLGVLSPAAALPRLVVEATYTQFHGDFGARSVAGSPLGFALLWTVAVLAGAIGWTVRCLRRFGAPARRD
jgi:hypothetical protein